MQTQGKTNASSLLSINTLANITLATSFNLVYATLLFLFYITDHITGLNIAVTVTVLLFACFSLIALFNHRSNFSHFHSTQSPIATAPQQTDPIKNRAEAAWLAKVAFLDTMNHEIRTPLNGIMGMTSLLMTTRQTAEQKKYIENISLSSQALLKALTELASFSKTQAHIPSSNTGSQNLDNIQALVPQEERILLAEDNPINQLVAQTMLKKLGFKNIDVAGNGLEVLKNLSQNKYDLIFMDCEMPQMDGYTAAKKIRETNKTIPIIAMTAHTAVEDKDLCLNSGMNDYIPKPVDRQTLVKTLATWLPQTA